ncbi:MAG TPA: AMP-binding protein, partial [Longimicrobiaceae bacterium]|nr:AMP-binding protein [Longimicrobiaceae bacterium]
AGAPELLELPTDHARPARQDHAGATLHVELGRLYAGFRAGREDPLPALPVQYADYAAWQRRWVQDRVLEAQAAYWVRALSGAPELLELPTDRARPARQEYAGASVRVELGETLTAALRVMGHRHGATPFVTLTAGWAVVLSRLSGQEDVVVGTPTANRGQREIEGLIGFFVNTLALRLDLSGHPRVSELLGRVRARALEAQQNQDIPFEQVVERLQVVRSLTHTPLFQVMFAWQSASPARMELPGLELAPVQRGARETAKFDLALGLSEVGGRIVGGLTYATSLFERETVERWVSYFRRVLEGMAADPGRGVDSLDLLSEAERTQVLEEWNRTEAAYPVESCIHELFEAQAGRIPDAVAVLCEDRALTYAELNERANRLARCLRELGVGPEARVGVCLERGLEMVVSILAVLKAGGAYVPLDPGYPAERLAFILQDSGVAVLLTGEGMGTRVPVPAGVRVVSIDGAAPGNGEESAANSRGGATPQSVAYLIYTSGSTGVPKGVAIEHGSAVALLSWAAGVYSAEDLSGVLASTSICFDLSVFELFLPLSRGGRVIVVENALAVAGSQAAREVRLINTVPSAIAALLRDGAIPPGVRTVNLAGEPLRAELADALYARGGIERVYDLYGPSEDTTYSTCALRLPGGPATIGRPVSNTRAYVLDGALGPVPPGVA